MASGHGPRGSEDVVAASTERTVLVRTRLLSQGGRPGLARPPWSLPFAHGGGFWTCSAMVKHTAMLAGPASLQAPPRHRVELFQLVWRCVSHAPSAHTMQSNGLADRLSLAWAMPLLRRFFPRGRHGRGWAA